jgi:hypothetical protein
MCHICDQDKPKYYIIKRRNGKAETILSCKSTEHALQLLYNFMEKDIYSHYSISSMFVETTES